MVVIGGFALLGQVSIRLDAVLEAVELLCPMSVCVFSAGNRIPLYLRPFSSTQVLSDVCTNLPARVGDLATGLADYTRSSSAYAQWWPMFGGRRSSACKSKHAPFKLMTSRILATFVP